MRTVSCGLDRNMKAPAALFGAIVGNGDRGVVSGRLTSIGVNGSVNAEVAGLSQVSSYMKPALVSGRALKPFLGIR